MTNSNLIKQILNVISPDEGTDLEWELIAKLVNETPTADLPNVIIENTPPETEPWRVGALFDHLIWNTPDEGAPVIRACEKWLTDCSDYRKVRYALAMTYIFPFKNPSEMRRLLLRIAQEWPDLRPRCEELIAARSTLREDSG